MMLLLMPADHVQATETLLLRVLLLGPGASHRPYPTAGRAAVRHEAMLSSRDSSPFLDFLAELSATFWVDELVAKLIEQGSAASVALACIQLRDLCYSSIRRLNLSSLHGSDSISMLEDQVHAVPEHFPNVKEVQLCFSDEESYHATPCLLQVLTRWVEQTILWVLAAAYWHHTCKLHVWGNWEQQQRKDDLPSTRACCICASAGVFTHACLQPFK